LLLTIRRQNSSQLARCVLAKHVFNVFYNIFDFIVYTLIYNSTIYFYSLVSITLYKRHSTIQLPTEMTNTLTSSCDVASFKSEVCWCSKESDPKHATYPWREHRLTSPQCQQPRHRLQRLHADPRRQDCIELFLCSASDPQYLSVNQQTCSFVHCRRHGACQTGLR